MAVSWGVSVGIGEGVSVAADVGVTLGSGDGVALAVGLRLGVAAGFGEGLGVAFFFDFVVLLCGVGDGRAVKKSLNFFTNDSSSASPRPSAINAIPAIIMITSRDSLFIVLPFTPPVLRAQLDSFACRRRDSRGENFRSANARGNLATPIRGAASPPREQHENPKQSECFRLRE